MNTILENEINRIKNLKNYQDLNEDEITKIAKINLHLKEFKRFPLFQDNPEEQLLAEERFKSYLEAHEIESLSEIDTLRSLIYIEILESRIQKELNKISKENKYPPEKLTTQLTDIQDQKSSLKIKLGIDKEEKEITDLTKLQKLEKRFEKYYQEHSNEFTTVCGCCGELLLLRRRVKEFDNLKHPWFAGRWLFNFPLLQAVKEGEISKELAAQILYGASKGKDSHSKVQYDYSLDYINYCIEHWAEMIQHLESQKE